jgi:hypothetical protein
VVVGQPVGVAVQRGFLRQHGQASEQGGGGVSELVIDVGDSSGAVQSLSDSSDSIQLTAGMTRVPGLAGLRDQRGQVQVHQYRSQPTSDSTNPERPIAASNLTIRE